MAQQTNSSDREQQAPQSQQQGPIAPDIPVDGDLSTFFKILAASLTADLTRLGGGDQQKPGQPLPERRRPGWRVSRAILAKRARDIEKAKKQRQEHNQPEKSRVPLMAMATAIMVVGGVMAAMPKHSEPLPASLIGTWHTTAEIYADRAFEIETDQITFQQGEADKSTTHPISRFQVTADETGSTFAMVEYDNDGDIYQFSFTYQPDEGTMRFKNQPLIVWYKR